MASPFITICDQTAWVITKSNDEAMIVSACYVEMTVALPIDDIGLLRHKLLAGRGTEGTGKDNTDVPAQGTYVGLVAKLKCSLFQLGF
jgi:hypothetical protein